MKTIILFQVFLSLINNDYASLGEVTRSKSNYGERLATQEKMNNKPQQDIDALVQRIGLSILEQNIFYQRAPYQIAINCNQIIIIND